MAVRLNVVGVGYDTVNSRLVRWDDATADFVTMTLSTLTGYAANETPTGAVSSTTGSDGNNTFTLANSPNPTSSLLVVVTNIVQLQGVHYTLSGATITFTSPYRPLSGETVSCWYVY